MDQPNPVRVGHKGAKVSWRKSSYSGSNGDCVELAELGNSVALRDSKDRQGPVVSVGWRTMTTFVSALKGGHMGAGQA
ncbi:DUF397 domain-containing protein [Streptomyces sp. DSM 40868]|nr:MULTISPECIES: DUF397 domain-containing protein [Streptomyces]QIS76263.1 DUF397 domain-containing protein [Streptomyces sp. DSM 40868]